MVEIDLEDIFNSEAKEQKKWEEETLRRNMGRTYMVNGVEVTTRAPSGGFQSRPRGPKSARIESRSKNSSIEHGGPRFNKK